MAPSCSAGENRSSHPTEDFFVRGCRLTSCDFCSGTDSPLSSFGVRFACSGFEQASTNEQYVAANSLAMYMWPTSQGFCQLLWTMRRLLGCCLVSFTGMAEQPRLHLGAGAATMASELVAESACFTSTSCRYSLEAAISTTPTQRTARQGQRQERCREGFSCAAGSEPGTAFGGTLAFGAANATSCQSAPSDDYDNNTSFSGQHTCGGETSSCRGLGQHPCRPASARVAEEAGAISGGIYPPAGTTHASTCVGKSAAPQGAGAASRRSCCLQRCMGGLCVTASGALVQARRVPLGGHDGLRGTGGRLVGQAGQRDASTRVGGQRWSRSQGPLHCGRRHGRGRSLGGHGCDCSGGGSGNPGEEPEVAGSDQGAQRAHSRTTPTSAPRSRGCRRSDQNQGWQPDSPQTAKQRRCKGQRRGHGWWRFTAVLHACGQGWHQEAPWIGLPSSLGVLGGPIGLRHSVMDEGDFTCSPWAAVLAANLELEVKLGDRSLDHFMTFAEDSRIASISSVDSCGNECLRPGIYAGPDFDAEDCSHSLEPATVQFPVEDELFCTYNCTGDIVHTTDFGPDFTSGPRSCLHEAPHPVPLRFAGGDRQLAIFNKLGRQLAQVGRSPRCPRSTTQLPFLPGNSPAARPFPATLQRVRPVACTALSHTGLTEARPWQPASVFAPKPAYPKPKSGPFHSAPPFVHILPEDLNGDEARNLCVSQHSWFTGFRATGGVTSRSQQNRYALFSVEGHAEVRDLGLGWSLADVIEDIRRAIPRLRNIRVLLSRMPGLPALQICATSSEVPLPGHAYPIDLRSTGGRICTIVLFPGMTASETRARIQEACPASRRPAQDFQLQLPDGLPFRAVPYQVLGPDFVRGAATTEAADLAVPDPPSEDAIPGQDEV